MIIWDGTDTGTFLDILECVERKETVEVAVRNDAPKTISKFADVRRLLPPRNAQTELTRQEYEDVLRTFMPSKEMREHLIGQDLSKLQIIDLILGSPVSLQMKAEYCRRLSARDDVFHNVLDRLEDAGRGIEARLELERELDHSFASHAQNIRTALDALELKQGEILLLYEAWYDEDYLEDNEGSAVPLLSTDAALRYIRDEMEEEEWDDETECWTRLEKWGPGKNGEMEHLYTYYLIADIVAFFEKQERDPNERRLWRTVDFDYASDSQNLNLPIPYQPGDIVEVNCLPFAPAKHVLLLEVGSDCCGVSALFHREDGKWDTGALKHGHCWGAYRPMLSPLYQIRSCNGRILFRGEGVLFSVQKYIAGDAEKGRNLWDAFYRSGSDGLKDKDLLKLIGDTHGDDVLLEYTAEHKICCSDVWDFWPWDVVDTEVQINHANDEELVITLFNPGRDESRVLFWNKAQQKVAMVAKARRCYDAVRFGGWVFTLSVTERPDGSLSMSVRQWDEQTELGITAFHYKAIDSLGRWPDWHFDVENDRLFVMLNGKRFEDVTPEEW